MTITPCVFVECNNSAPFAVNAFMACDRFVPIHVLNPFLIYFLTHSFIAASFIVMLNEVFEVMMVIVAGNFVLFFGAEESCENLADIFLTDIVLPLVIAGVVGLSYIRLTNSPQLVAPIKDWYRDKRRWFFWVGYMLLLQIPIAFYAKETASGFSWAVLWWNLMFPVLTLIALWLTTEVKWLYPSKTGGKPTAITNKTIYSLKWFGMIIIVLSWSAQSTADFFFSSMWQCILIGGVWLFIFSLVYFSNLQVDVDHIQTSRSKPIQRSKSRLQSRARSNAYKWVV